MCFNFWSYGSFYQIHCTPLKDVSKLWYVKSCHLSSKLHGKTMENFLYARNIFTNRATRTSQKNPAWYQLLEYSTALGSSGFVSRALPICDFSWRIAPTCTYKIRQQKVFVRSPSVFENCCICNVLHVKFQIQIRLNRKFSQRFLALKRLRSKVELKVGSTLHNSHEQCCRADGLKYYARFRSAVNLCDSVC